MIWIVISVTIFLLYAKSIGMAWFAIYMILLVIMFYNIFNLFKK